MDYDVLAFIGRFQPFHDGHKAVVDEALSRAKKVALVIGSHDQPRSARNPFSTSERIEMISAVYPEEVSSGRIHFVPQVDHTYNMGRWISGVQTGVNAIANTPFTPDPVRIGLIGHSKDNSSFYLKSFPTWGSVEAQNYKGINATELRELLFEGRRPTVGWTIPEAVRVYLDAWMKKDAYIQVGEEFAFIKKYKKQWEGSPYDPTFHTVDTVVVQSGHVLLVERGAMPGKDLWALPGGFLDASETTKQSALRELREETRIDLSDSVLNGAIRAKKQYDDPHRSQRGRTITTAFYIELSPRDQLPKIKGSDDAAKAQWVPMSNLSRSGLYEDHYDIIEDLVGL